MAQKEFFRDVNDETRLRVSVVTERGKVKRFLVQLEVLQNEEWMPVARYDTHHGFAHLDILHPDGTQDKIRLVARDFKDALDLAFTDMLTNWERYVRAYLKEI
jgi:hypothetical protein